MATLQGRILKYTLLPGILPRLHELFTSGFAHIAFTMALVYRAVRLLPEGHPYLDPRNLGRYGLRHVMVEAANNLVFSRRNIDQIIIFFTILCGIAILFAQFVLLIVALLAQQPALAAAALPPDLNVSFTNILGELSAYGHGATGNKSQDIAFIILDRVFGLQGQGPEGIFGSCISTAAVCTNLDNVPVADPGANYPFPFHRALHLLFKYYSMGIFMVSIIVILYFIVTVIGETAITGSPFGQRFNKTWAPVRLILFFALLMPLNTGNANEGLNGAQMITFWTAKLGSNFATNAWGRFNDVLTGTYLGDADSLVAKPNPPEMNDIVRFMFVAKTCKITEEYAYGHQPEAGTIYPSGQAPDGVQAYLVRGSSFFTTGDNWMDLATTDFATALSFSNNGNIEIAFGVRDGVKYKLEKASVKPICGSLVVPVTSVDTPAPGFSGAYGLQNTYYDMIKAMWSDAQMVQGGRCIRDRIMQLNHNPNCTSWPDRNYATNQINYWSNYIKTRITAQVNNEVANSDWGVNQRLKDAGWAGAAIWYNRIAQVNGEFMNALANVPYGSKFPFVMEYLAEQNRGKNASLNPTDVFDPALAGNAQARYPRWKDRMVAATYYNAYHLWDATGATKSQKLHKTNNVFIDGVNAIFGTQGIFSMRENPNIHPLAQLSALGKGMMEASLRNLAVGIVAGGSGGILKDFIGPLGSSIVSSAASFLFTMGKATIVMSFILYYVLPFLPFIYFFFAVSGWIKSIFEAVVAMPLWALAHISRLDGNGIPGPGANNGYFLLLEIFLRPILILTGLLASLSIFSACVFVLNDIFKLISSNVSGFSMEAETAGTGPSEIAFYRGPIDQFFFTAIYVIICYMMATGFFKMIDQVPNNILRWMGVSVSTFSEAAGDPAGELTQKVYQGGSLSMNQFRGGALVALLGK